MQSAKACKSRRKQKNDSQKEQNYQGCIRQLHGAPSNDLMQSGSNALSSFPDLLLEEMEWNTSMRNNEDFLKTNNLQKVPTKRGVHFF